MKFILSNCPYDEKAVAVCPFNLDLKILGSWHCLFENLDDLKSTRDHYSITEGYLRDLNKDINDFRGQEESVINEISSSWPLPANITGSFSITIVEKKTSEIIICNDVIGIYPLYYLKRNNEIYISNSILLIGILTGADFDEAGILQRCIGPEYSNIGSRTIIKDCRRLLPGEFLKFGPNGQKIKIGYDNSLYNEISSPNPDESIISNFWRNFKKEIAYCTNKSETVSIALSGGMDSRILLGAIADEKKVKCLTYGKKDFYETKLSSRLAGAKKAYFQNFSEQRLYFPSYNILRKYTLQTEAVNINSWLEVLENIEVSKKHPLLLGDMAEALNGRNIKKFSSKKFRQTNFFKYNLLNKEYQFEIANSQNFDDWKRKTLKFHDRWYNESRLSQYSLKTGRNELIDSLHSDLQELFDRIQAHNLPFAELYDELFSWYTHSRVPMAKQILINNKVFDSYCPSMSNQILRYASNIHPNFRLNSRFLNLLFKKTKDLTKLNRFPTSQAPLMPNVFPSLIKYPVWGLRSKIDEYFIKRMIRTKDAGKRYRLFKSINWVEIYQNPEMIKNLKEYFAKNHLGTGFLENTIKTCVQRKELKQWPFSNIEIITASSLNIELDFIKSIRRSKNFMEEQI